MSELESYCFHLSIFSVIINIRFSVEDSGLAQRGLGALPANRRPPELPAKHHGGQEDPNHQDEEGSLGVGDAEDGDGGDLALT